MVDITPLIPADRQVVQRYGDGGFRVSGTRYEGSILVFPERILPWPVTETAGIDRNALEPVFEAGVEILLIGGGRSPFQLDPDLRGSLRESGIVADAMDTGAACRTYNVLLSEDRRVAAALIAV